MRKNPTPKPPILKLREISPVFERPPDSPEGVALALFRLLMVVQGTDRAAALDLYAECLTAARGERLQSNHSRH